jgi:aspartate racemase
MMAPEGRRKYAHPSGATTAAQQIASQTGDMTEQNRIVGVLGGMGPDATVDFMSKVIAATPADRDQDHAHMIIDHNPKVPNRQAAILGGGEDPGLALAEMAVRLERAGADFLVIPCNSAYVFRDSVTAVTGIPLLSIIDVTIAVVAEQCPGAKSVGVLATDGCLRAKVYQDAMAGQGIEAILPGEQEIGEFMKLVGRIKGGYQGDTIASKMAGIANALVGRGAQAVIAGCTEIPLVLNSAMLDVPFISSTDVLAEKTAAIACGELPLPSRE